jgi:4-hydroxy-tetrahydrodipicolinate synthase
MAEIINLCGDRLSVLSGDDGMVLPLLAIGGKGVVSVVNNLVPRQVADVVNAWNAGDVELARKRYFDLLPLCSAMFVETNPIPIKTAMALTGLIPSDEMRLPMCPLLPDNLAKLKKVLADYGLLK